MLVGHRRSLGVVLSFGPAMPLYGWLFEALPPLRAMRVAVALGRAVPDRGRGAGRASAPRRCAPASASAAARRWPGLLPALVTLEAARTPMAFTPTPPMPAVYPAGGAAARGDARVSAVPRRAVQPQRARICWRRRCTSIRSSPATAGSPRRPTPARTTTLGRFPGRRGAAMIRTLGRDPRGAAPRAAGRAASARRPWMPSTRVPWLTREFADDEARVYRVVDEPRRARALRCGASSWPAAPWRRGLALAGAAAGGVPAA